MGQTGGDSGNAACRLTDPSALRWDLSSADCERIFLFYAENNSR